MQNWLKVISVSQSAGKYESGFLLDVSLIGFPSCVAYVHWTTWLLGSTLSWISQNPVVALIWFGKSDCKTIRLVDYIWLYLFVYLCYVVWLDRWLREWARFKVKGHFKMSELEQLRQEAEQLKNQIRVCERSWLLLTWYTILIFWSVMFSLRCTSQGHHGSCMKIKIMSYF